MRRVIRKYVPPQPEEDSYGPRPLPVNDPWVVYGRQSTTRQLEQNDESTRDQIEGLLARAIQKGYNPELGTVYQEGDGVRGVSGRLRIDQRGDLSTVDARICRDEVKTVYIRDESRLFRDRSGVQYNTFADHCYQHDCLVITRDYVYDFRRNPDAIRRWRRKCEEAADYITDQIGMMNRYRMEKARSGQWVSAWAPVGYIIEQERIGRKTLRRLVPYRPYAEKVEWLFRRFKELGGNVNRLMREIQRMRVLFPDTDVRLSLTKVVGGWTISKHGLIHLLTNPVYIGHHCVEGRIAKKYNHPAIVSEELFFYAFNRLSDVDLDGNPQEQVEGRPTRYRHLTTPPCHALLEDVIAAEEQGYGAYVHRPKHLYDVLSHKNGMHMTSFTLPISVLDTVFTEQFIRAVKEDKRMGEGEAYRTLQQVQQSDAGSSVEDQLANVTRRIDLLRAKIDITEDLTLVRKWNTELRELNQTQAQLEQVLKRKDELIKTEQEYHTLLERIRGEWGRMTPEQKKKAVDTLIEKVTLVRLTSHWYRIVIYWRVPQGRVDEGYLFDRHTRGITWSTEEENTLRNLYPHAHRLEVQNALPERAWKAIVDKAGALGVERTVRTESNFPLAGTVTMKDMWFAEKHGLKVPEKRGDEHVNWSTKVNTSRCRNNSDIPFPIYRESMLYSLADQ